MFDFPSSPTNGQVYTPVGGPTYYWDATDGAWRLAGATSGPGSLLDADTLDGHDSPYFATQTALTTEKTRNDAQDTAIALRITDAPSDTNSYGRKAAAWVDVTEEAPADGLGYMRKNGAWAPSSGGAWTDDAPPAPPLQDGQLWFKSTTGVLYIYYDDGTSQQWVQVSASPQSPNQGFALATAKPKNLLVNPNMQVSQENGNTAVSTSGAYPADQWKFGFSGVVGTASQSQAIVSPDNSLNCVSQWVSTAKPSLAAGDFCQLYQTIEGLRAADLAWGTTKAIPAVLRFNACADVAGTYSVSIGSGNADYTWLGAFACDGTTTMKTFVFAIPAQTAGTFPKDNTAGLLVHFCHTAGSTYVGVAGWQTGNKLAVPAQINGANVANKGLVITDVGLYADPQNTGLPPAYQAPDYPDDLQRCLRYFYKPNLGGVNSFPFRAMNYSAGAGTAVGLGAPWPVLMRTTPTVSIGWQINDVDQSGNPANTQGSVTGWNFISFAVPSLQPLDVTSVIGNARM
jgi:hypothetical protein